MLDTASVRELGSQPVSAERPAGTSSRDGASFTALKSQIDRLTDLHAGQAVEWPIVERLSAQILREEGKDLAAGTWLAMALYRQRGLSGLADGIHVLRELVENWWEDMSPPAARLRGRRNQMQWLLDQLSAEFNEQAILEISAIPQAQHADMLADWEALDTAWQAHDDEAPAFYGLAAVLRRLPVEAETVAEPEEPAAAPVSSTVDTPTDAVVAPSLAARSGADSAATPSRPAPIAPPVQVQAPVAGTDVATAVDHALESLQPLIAWMLAEHPLSPLLFRLNRICAWAGLDSCPPAKGRVTLLPPPGQALDIYERVVQAADPQAIISFAESRLRSMPYWLDLNRVSHAALTELQAHDAALELARETANFLARMPGVAELAFSDGRAFADPATQAWLQALRAPSVGNEAPAQDELAAVTNEAETQAVAGKLTEAISQLQAAVRRAEGGRASFRLRLAQCSLIHRFDAKTDLRPIIHPLIEQVEAQHLASWEPELARQALELAAGIEQRHGGGDQSPVVPMLGRLSRVDVNAAWQLSQSTAG